MDDIIKKHLSDILLAIEEINDFWGDGPKLFDDFLSNLCLRRAIERNIEIVGEAVNRILKVESMIPITDSRKIVDARNYIIHGYDRSVRRYPLEHCHKSLAQVKTGSRKIIGTIKKDT